MSESKGTYSVSKSSTYKCGWRLRRKVWIDQKPVTQVVPQKAWKALGFTQDMSLETARARASQLNELQSLESEKIRKAANRVIRIDRVESAFLPEHLVVEFQNQILGRRFAGEIHRKKMVSHWRKLQKLIVDVEIEPSQYSEHSEKIYDWFIENELSLQYTLKLIALLNRWGLFCCKKEGKFFEPIHMPKGKDRELIADTYYESEGFRGESDPLTPEELESKKNHFSEAQYRWLLVSIWFGLRPQEINALKIADPSKWKVEYNNDLGVEVLSVYQPKLVTIEREKRWKRIPVFLPKQKLVLAYIMEGGLKTPLYKKMSEVFTGKRITLYGGRKNFEDLMKTHGQQITDIAQWLGHQTIERTWTKYRNKNRVSFTKVS
jgi:integrase